MVLGRKWFWDESGFGTKAVLVVLDEIYPFGMKVVLDQSVFYLVAWWRVWKNQHMQKWMWCYSKRMGVGCAMPLVVGCTRSSCHKCGSNKGAMSTDVPIIVPLFMLDPLVECQFGLLRLTHMDPVWWYAERGHVLSASKIPISPFSPKCCSPVFLHGASHPNLVEFGRFLLSH